MAWKLTERETTRNYTDLEERVVFRQGYNDGFSSKPKEGAFADYYADAYGAGYEDGQTDAATG